jgi:hypothetical protein
MGSPTMIVVKVTRFKGGYRVRMFRLMYESIWQQEPELEREGSKMDPSSLIGIKTFWIDNLPPASISKETLLIWPKISN